MMVVGRGCDSAWGGGGDLLGERCIMVSVYLLGVVFVIAISPKQWQWQWVELIAIIALKQAQPAKKWVRGAPSKESKKGKSEIGIKLNSQLVKDHMNSYIDEIFSFLTSQPCPSVDRRTVCHSVDGSSLLVAPSVHRRGHVALADCIATYCLLPLLHAPFAVILHARSMIYGLLQYHIILLDAACDCSSWVW